MERNRDGKEKQKGHKNESKRDHKKKSLPKENGKVVQLHFWNSCVLRVWHEWLQRDDEEAGAENASGVD